MAVDISYKTNSCSLVEILHKVYGKPYLSLLLPPGSVCKKAKKKKTIYFICTVMYTDGLIFLLD